MNTLLEISNNIIQCSQNDKLEIIISLRAFLFDKPVLYWVDFTNCDNCNEKLLQNQILCPSQIKKINEANLKKIGLKPIDLFLLPKNKKNKLVDLIEEIFEDLQILVVFDKIRLNPFYEDTLFLFIENNKSLFSNEIFQIYKNRNNEMQTLLFEAGIENQIYENCFTISRKNKVRDYWVNIWGQSINYKDPSLIEHLIIK